MINHLFGPGDPGAAKRRSQGQADAARRIEQRKAAKKAEAETAQAEKDAGR
jgi:hypothetical protein